MDGAAENVTWIPLNTTTVLTLSPNSQDTSIAVALLKTIASVLIVTVNILIIATFCLKRALRTLSNAFVVSLAVADLLVGVVVFVGALTWVPLIQKFVVTSGEFCLARLCGYIVSCASSTMNICLIALERYLYIVHPYCHQRYLNKTVVSVVVGLVWLGATVFGVCPPVLLFTYTEEHTCDYYYALGPVYSVYGIFAVIFLTGVPTLIFYVLIARLALEKRREVLYHMSALADREATDRIYAAFRKKLRALKAPVVVFGGFFVCWFPQVITYVIHELVVKLPRQTRAMVTNVAVFNSAVNFFVYLALNRQFREAVLRPACRSKRNGQTGSRGRSSLSADSTQGTGAKTSTVSAMANCRDGIGQERACKDHNKIENGERSKSKQGELDLTENGGGSKAGPRF